MPVTRDMTEGERRLLYNFLDSPLEEGAGPSSWVPRRCGRRRRSATSRRSAAWREARPE